MKNPGFCPPMLRGRRVKVRLRNGRQPEESWAADGPHGCRWTLTGHPYDILEFEVAQ